MKAYLSALGMMGRRHLLGLLHAGFQIDAYDPANASIEKAKEAVRSAGFDETQVHYLVAPSATKYNIAIFSETADFRLSNLKKFYETSSAERILLEKPLCQSQEDLKSLTGWLEDKSLLNSVWVNHPRRTWPVNQYLKALCQSSEQVDITINAGAIGLGCNGIHLLDFWEFLFPDIAWSIISAQIPEQQIPSGRGPQFSDLGAYFHLKKKRHNLMAALSPTSSAGVEIAIRGEHFTAWIDEMNLTYRLWQRKADSALPIYRTGADYSIVNEEKMELPELSFVTQRWTKQPQILPQLSEALKCHQMLFDILSFAKFQESIRFT